MRAFDFYTDAQRAACLAGTDTDVSSALTAAIAAARSRVAPHLVIDAGRHFIGNTTITMDLPDNSTVDFVGSIYSAASAKDALVIGKASDITRCLTISGLKIHRTLNDPTSGSVGVRLLNLVFARVHIPRCVAFTSGIIMEGNAHGCAYNTIFPGFVHDNTTNLRLTASALGYCNENTIIAGSFNHSGGWPGTSSTNILIDHYAASPLSNNVFFHPSLEDNADPAGSVVAAVINGENNALFMPRLENSAVQATYLIKLTANSLGCQLIGDGFGVQRGNIDDLGSGNSYDTRDGRRLARSTPAASNRSVLSLQSTNSNTARALQILDTAGAESGYIDCSGDAALHTATVSVSYKVGGTKVLGAQGAAVADATDAASAITQLNALLARARAHGWIAT
ncbi:MAG TPA: hypothetical protein VK614_11540 [Allosphingosinicella sp.]|nr:hypothetical protein [Allosphingosinicella sp.]